MRDIRYLDDVTSLRFNQELCIGCGLCIAVCPQSVFELEDGKSHIVDKNACMECGACVNNCPTHAVEVHPGVG